jgi:voltage-gated potassium channel
MQEPQWRTRLNKIIYESDTPAGRAFDKILIAAIVASVALVMLESVPSVRAQHGLLLRALEWSFTGLFTFEYFLRLIAGPRPLRYVFSFYGLVDLFSILPTYLSAFIPGAISFLALRVFRLLRIFRIFKLSSYLGEAEVLQRALRAGRPKIIVFLTAVGATVITMGTVMYLVEGEANGFTSIPTAVYWAIVTMTTVGFGDITPRTPLGQALASLLMVLGYGVIAVPTGIVTNELHRASGLPNTLPSICPGCGAGTHPFDAKFCRLCGHLLKI